MALWVCSLSEASFLGCLLAYLMRTSRMREMMGMLITMVSSATTMMKIGSLGGGARVHVRSSELQLHRDVLDCTVEGAPVHAACDVSEKMKKI